MYIYLNEERGQILSISLEYNCIYSIISNRFKNC